MPEILRITQGKKGSFKLIKTPQSNTNILRMLFWVSLPHFVVTWRQEQICYASKMLLVPTNLLLPRNTATRSWFQAEVWQWYQSTRWIAMCVSVTQPRISNTSLMIARSRETKRTQKCSPEAGCFVNWDPRDPSSVPEYITDHLSLGKWLS